MPFFVTHSSQMIMPGFSWTFRPRWISASALCLLPLAGCASGPGASPSPQPVMQAPVTVTAAPTTAPAATPTTGTAEPRAPKAEPAPETARADWHRLSMDTDGVVGVGSERAIRELLANRRPQRAVVVAVLDGGVDTAHTRLAGTIWRNPKEVAGNGKDDDGNGFIDDTFGWNLLATPSGETIGPDTFELTRLYAACRGLAAGRDTPKPSAASCDSVSTAYQEKAREVTGTLAQVRQIEAAYTRITATLSTAIPGTLTAAAVRGFTPANSQQEQARGMWLQLDANGLSADAIADAKKAYTNQASFGLDTLYQPRTGPSKGSRDVTGPDALHGTHVAGIIGAVRDGTPEVQGIAPNVQLMAVRVVPDGDERDTDVARAIRYAVDNGAQIINMSFGKSFSPQKAAVDSAVRYATSKGVLLVHAAGNDAENNDITPSYPTSVLADGTRVGLWLEVGASSWKGNDNLVAPFSNYGRQRVDLFAPGEDILSTAPGGGAKRESGTSMAAPVVSGVAALLMAYFPALSAADVQQLLLQTVRTFPGTQVKLPGSGQMVPFANLSRTGGVIDAYAAVKRALEMETKK